MKAFILGKSHSCALLQHFMQREASLLRNDKMCVAFQSMSGHISIIWYWWHLMTRAVPFDSSQPTWKEIRLLIPDLKIAQGYRTPQSTAPYSTRCGETEGVRSALGKMDDQQSWEINNYDCVIAKFTETSDSHAKMPILKWMMQWRIEPSPLAAKCHLWKTTWAVAHT